MGEQAPIMGLCLLRIPMALGIHQGLTVVRETAAELRLPSFLVRQGRCAFTWQALQKPEAQMCSEMKDQLITLARNVPVTLPR